MAVCRCLFQAAGHMVSLTGTKFKAKKKTSLLIYIFLTVKKYIMATMLLLIFYILFVCNVIKVLNTTIR